MKNILLVGFVFGAFILTSCKKDWDCVCSGTVLGIQIPDQVAETLKDMKKKDAKEKCDKYEADAKAAGVADANCELKKK